MKDESGNRIDLDLIDAIGRLADGRFDVWMQDGTRAITTEPFADDKWRNYIRSKSYTTLRSTSRFTATTEVDWRKIMNRVLSSEKSNNPMNILNQLAMQDSESTVYLITNTREEYDLLIKEAINGRLQNAITLSRSGIRLNKKQIIPPESYLCHFAVERAEQYA